MNKAIEIKKQYGTLYMFRKYLNDRQVSKLKSAPPSSFSDIIVSSLKIGYVRLDAVLFRSNMGLELAYDVFVKDDPDSPEWIYYDNLSEPVSTTETDMLIVLDRIAVQNGLSYTECCFQKLDGKTVNRKKKPQIQSL